MGNQEALAAERTQEVETPVAARTPGRWPDPIHREFLRLRRSRSAKGYRSRTWLRQQARETVRAAIALASGGKP